MCKLLYLIGVLCTSVSASIVDFNTLPTSRDGQVVPGNFHGFNWEGVSYLTYSSELAGSGFDMGSGGNLAYIPEASPFVTVAISRETLFDFNGMSLTNAANIPFAGGRNFISIEIAATANGELRGLQFFTFGGPPMTVETNSLFSGIDQLSIRYRRTLSEDDERGFGDQLIISDFDYTASVPEANMSILFFVGLSLTLLLQYRRTRELKLAS